MTARTRVMMVTFRNSFLLPGMEREHAPGVFEVHITEEPLNLMWEAYHRTMMLMLTTGGMTEAIKLTPEDLEAALARDSGDG
jgi:hypothetical protein